MTGLSRRMTMEACAVFLMMFTLASCAYSEEKDQIMGSTPTGSAVTLAYLKSAIFTPKCASCHPGSSFDISDYAQLSARVVAGNASASTLYRRVTDSAYGTIMPQGAPPLSSGEKQAIADWINNGAQNN